MDIQELRNKINAAWFKAEIKFVGLKSRDLAITLAVTEFVKEYEAALQSANSNSTQLCYYDRPDGCHAVACYSSQKCGSRDEKGNPKYL